MNEHSQSGNRDNHIVLEESTNEVSGDHYVNIRRRDVSRILILGEEFCFKDCVESPYGSGIHCFTACLTL